MASGNEARQYLVMRYSAAIRGYVRAITRDEDQADELTQDVMVRLLKGDFAGADPAKGRFRDLLKTAIRNMTRNHWAKQKVRRPVDYDVSEVELGEEELSETVWEDSWQKHLLDLAWGRLREYQETHAGSAAYTALKLRSEFPDDSSDELAERLSVELGKPVRSDQARQLVRRARVRFADFLVSEVADGLQVASQENIEEELSQVGLLDRIRDVLPAGWGSSKE
jgi:RNA polymerase sigma factor (sigma-70 family)